MRSLLAIGAGLVLMAGAVAWAQTPAAPKRTTLQQTEYPDGHVIIMQLLELAPATPIARHTHPGVETSYVLEGEVELTVAGKAPRSLKTGDSFAVPANTPHSAKVGGVPTRLIITYVVDKSQPVASPAPEK